MITSLAILPWIKSKLFSTAGIFIGVLSLLVTIFIWSNSDLIMSKFGFETRSNLKGSLVEAKGNLTTAITVNENLNKELKQLHNYSTAVVKIIENTHVEKNVIEKKVTSIAKVKKEKVTPHIEILDKDKVEGDTTITLNKAELNKVSEVNITSIHEAYDEMFKSTEG